MTESNQNRIYIPEPCHEDWEQMTPEGRGRFCQACTKVVVDFAQSSLPEINQQVREANGQICGRVPQRLLEPTPLMGQLLQRYPAARMRNFLLAFVTTFGLSVWGLEGQEALATSPESISMDMHPTQEDSVKVSGRIMSEIDGSPMAYVTLVVKVGEEIVAGVLSDSTGGFTLVFPASKIPEGGYDLVVSYLNRERVEKSLGTDVREMLFLIDDSFVLDDVKLHEAYASRRNRTGMIDPEPIFSMVGRVVLDDEPLQRFYYPPVDDWLMMHNSEVNQAGRW